MTVTPPETVDAAFPHVDVLRAVGALAVLTTHVGFTSGEYLANGTVGALLSRLDVGVALFFVLSGFLLSRGWLARAAAGRPAPATGHYLWKRLLRIVPVYVLTATIALTLIEANAEIGWGERWATYLLGSTLVDSTFPAGLTHMWSLAVELHFYLLLPLLMVIAVGRRLRPARVVALLVVLVVLSVWWHLDGAARASGDSMVATLQWLPGYLDWFAVGIGLALASVLDRTGRGGRLVAGLRTLAEQPGVCWLLAAGLLLVATTPLAGPLVLNPPTDAEALFKNLVYAVVGGLVVLPAVLRDVPDEPAVFDRLFLHPVARHLGHTSYGLFCVHILVIHLLLAQTTWEVFTAPFVPLWLLTTATSLVAAELAYRLVERPALRLKGHHPLARRRPGSAASTTAPTSGTSTR